MLLFARDIKRNKNALDKIKYTSGPQCIKEMIEEINFLHRKKPKMVGKVKVYVK